MFFFLFNCCSSKHLIFNECGSSYFPHRLTLAWFPAFSGYVETPLCLESSSRRGGNRQLSEVATCFPILRLRFLRSQMISSGFTAVNPTMPCAETSAADLQCLILKPHNLNTDGPCTTSSVLQTTNPEYVEKLVPFTHK